MCSSWTLPPTTVCSAKRIYSRASAFTETAATEVAYHKSLQLQEVNWQEPETIT